MVGMVMSCEMVRRRGVMSGGDAADRSLMFIVEEEDKS